MVAGDAPGGEEDRQQTHADFRRGTRPRTVTQAVPWRIRLGSARTEA